MKKQTLLGMALASAMTLSAMAMAAPQGGPEAGGHGHGGRHGQHHGAMGMLHKLNLTDAQKAQVKQLMQTARTQNKPQRDDLRQQRRAFETMTPDQVGYQAAAGRLAQAEGQATTQRVQQRATLRAQIYALLTPAQKAQAATMQAQRQARHQQWQEFRQTHPVENSAS